MPALHKCVDGGSSPFGPTTNSIIMIKLYQSLPKEVYVACSGGVDSVALALFLKASGRKVTLVHYNHPDDPLAAKEEQYVSDLLSKFGFDGKISSFDAPIAREEIRYFFDGGKRASLSKEVFWRENRLAFFRSIGKPILTGHHLDDALEWYVLTMIKTGQGQFMKYESECTLKPFLLMKKEELVEWMQTKYPGVEWLEDPSNTDPDFNDRNFLRVNVIPGILHLNQGLYKTIKNKFETRIRDERMKKADYNKKKSAPDT